MDWMPPNGLLEAARLKRAGLLSEATAWVRRLASGEAGLAPWAQPAPPEPQPSGGRFLAACYSGEAGTLAYKVYVPGGGRRGALPLVVMLHGCTQSPDDFAAGTRMNLLAEADGFLVLYPAQSGTANAQRCWNWFRPEDQRRDTGEPALIAGATREVMRTYAVDPARVYVAGLSAGGAAAAIMGAAYPELYRAVGVHSGLACGAAHDMMSAFNAMRQGAGVPPPPGRGIDATGATRVTPTIVFHADSDTTVHPRNADQVIAQAGAPSAGAPSAGATQAGLRVEEHRGSVPGGHAYSRTVHRNARGQIMLEQWVVHGAGHAWSGGSTDGSYADPRGPDASREMLRFFRDCGRAEG